MHLFTYGTLMFRQVWDRVAGRRFETERATVAGFDVFRVVNGVYPVMVYAAGDKSVRGMAYRDVDAKTFQALDEFESDLYERVAVNAVTEAGETLSCQAYVLPSDRQSRASAERWNAEAFEREELAAYLRRIE